MERIHERQIQLRLDFCVMEQKGYKQNTQNLFGNSNYYHLQEDPIGLICTQA